MPSVQRFLIQDGAQAGKAVDLVAFPFTVGRARECDFVLDFTEVSRLHAECTSDHLNI
ncbi:MAG: FHA domain-containing protein [Anaerolineae bacterium]|nr:FHA domain-containing protein [Anaerolineae bacterium]